jgi:Complex 1 protein (LYR family)
MYIPRIPTKRIPATAPAQAHCTVASLQRDRGRASRARLAEQESSEESAWHSTHSLTILLPLRQFLRPNHSYITRNPPKTTPHPHLSMSSPALSSYRRLLRAAGRLPDAKDRAAALAQVRGAFRANRLVSSPDECVPRHVSPLTMCSL